jgi:hypothetical protein
VFSLWLICAKNLEQQKAILFGMAFSSCLYFAVFNNAVLLRILNNSGILIIKTQQQH